jgi:hypothetical protein
MEKGKLSNNIEDSNNDSNYNRRDFIKYLGLLAISVPTLSSCDYLFGTTLSSECQPISGGTINPSSGNYDKNVVVEIIAIPSAGYRFDHWEGSVSGQSSAISLTMDKSKKVIAYFIKTYELSVSATPSGGGNVSPGSRKYDEGQIVTLSASPSKYYEFSGWVGDISETSNPISLTINSDMNVVALFTKLKYPLQTNLGTPGGTVEPNGGSYDAGSTIQVKAIPSTGYRFSHWEGSSTSTNRVVELLMDSPKTLTAFFTKTYSLSTSVDPLNSGAIDPFEGVYDQGTHIQIIAIPNFPYAFTNWSGTENNNINPTTVTINSDMMPIAYFTKLSPGEQQVLTGSRVSNLSPSPLIPVEAGQWVELGVKTSGLGTALRNIRVLSPDFEVIQDLGLTNNATCQFQAQKTGDYIVEIQTSLLVYYTVTYTIYS